MSTPFLSYFDFNIARLKLAAVWIYEKNTPQRTIFFQNCYNIFWATYLYFIYFPTECLATLDAHNDFTILIRDFRDMGNHIGLIIKAVNWYLKRKQILRLLKVLEHYNIYYEESEECQPKVIIEKHRIKAEKWSKILFRLINTICGCMFISGIFVFIFKGEDNYVWENGVRYYRQKLPVNVFPLFGNKNRAQFLVTFIYVLAALTFYGWMISGLDSLFITILSCVSAHLRILESAIKTIRLRCCRRIGIIPKDELYDPLRLQMEMQNELKACLIHLQMVYRCSTEIEDIYSIQTLLQIFISLYEICFCMYLLSISRYDSLGSELTYLFSTGFQLLLYCWFGNMVTDASTSVSYALYDCEWFASNMVFKKQIIFTMARMNKPIYVTVGKITPLSFITFITIARGAYSYFTFLKRNI
nr:odorant receptor [Semanotus bifasciatus]